MTTVRGGGDTSGEKLARAAHRVVLSEIDGAPGVSDARTLRFSQCELDVKYEPKFDRVLYTVPCAWNTRPGPLSFVFGTEKDDFRDEFVRPFRLVIFYWMVSRTVSTISLATRRGNSAHRIN